MVSAFHATTAWGCLRRLCAAPLASRAAAAHQQPLVSAPCVLAAAEEELIKLLERETTEHLMSLHVQQAARSLRRGAQLLGWLAAALEAQVRM